VRFPLDFPARSRVNLLGSTTKSGATAKLILYQYKMTDSSLHLTHLNDKQREAATAPWEGVLAIMAGPGSGKTKTLISRLAHLIQVCGLHPTSLVIITFTNKAAEEIKTRCETVLGHEQSKGLVAGTFHSVCATWLRKHGSKIGLNRNFGILDNEEGLTIVKRLMKDLKVEEIKPRTYCIVGRRGQKLICGQVPFSRTFPKQRQRILDQMTLLIA